MTIKAQPEGREGVWLPERESLKSWILEQNFDGIHNFNTSVPGVMLGADHDVDSVLEDIDRADKVAILTGMSRRQNMNHALALIMPAEGSLQERLEVFDIGEVTDEDIEETA